MKAQRSKPVSLCNVDAVISAGGDGTFLEAASLVGWTPLPCSLNSVPLRRHGVTYDPRLNSSGHVYSLVSTRDEGSAPQVYLVPTPCIDRPIGFISSIQKPVWVFGINTDPSRSEGRLLIQTPQTRSSSRDLSETGVSDSLDWTLEPSVIELRDRFRPRTHSEETGKARMLSEASLDWVNCSIDKIVNGTFRPMRRRRIRVTIFDPLPAEKVPGPPGVALRERSITRRREDPSTTADVISLAAVSYTRSSPSFMVQENSTSSKESVDIHPAQKYIRRSSTQAWDRPVDANELGRSYHTVKYRAVNDVLVTSAQSHMATYIEISVDEHPPQRSKNSGVIVCTGKKTRCFQNVGHFENYSHATKIDFLANASNSNDARNTFLSREEGPEA